MDPRGQRIINKYDRKEGIFYFNATKKGIYSFIFCNKKWANKKQVTFAVHTGNSTDQVLEEKHISPLQNKILSIEKKINVRF